MSNSIEGMGRIARECWEKKGGDADENPSRLDASILFAILRSYCPPANFVLKVENT